MAAFDPAFKKVFQNEGGFSDHPNDKGGKTNYGITQKLLTELGFNMDVKDLTPEYAKQIYYTHFWCEYKYTHIDKQEIANQVFDACVNMGPSHAHQCVQRALRACGFKEIKDDGVLGPKTRTALNQVSEPCWLAAFASELAGYYRLLAALDSSQRVFLDGWLGHRAYDDSL